MNDSKKPWLSKTLWLNFIGGIASAVAVFYPNANVVTQFIASNAVAIGTVWSVLNMILRVVTKDAISLQD